MDPDPQHFFYDNLTKVLGPFAKHSFSVADLDLVGFGLDLHSGGFALDPDPVRSGSMKAKMTTKRKKDHF
jgi:hypothetical protein